MVESCGFGEVAAKPTLFHLPSTIFCVAYLIVPKGFTCSSIALRSPTITIDWFSGAKYFCATVRTCCGVTLRISGT